MPLFLSISFRPHLRPSTFSPNTRHTHRYRAVLRQRAVQAQYTYERQILTQTPLASPTQSRYSDILQARSNLSFTAHDAWTRGRITAIVRPCDAETLEVLRILRDRRHYKPLPVNLANTSTQTGGAAKEMGVKHRTDSALLNRHSRQNRGRKRLTVPAGVRAEGSAECEGDIDGTYNDREANPSVVDDVTLHLHCSPSDAAKIVAAELGFYGVDHYTDSKGLGLAPATPRLDSGFCLIDNARNSDSFGKTKTANMCNCETDEESKIRNDAEVCHSLLRRLIL